MRRYTGINHLAMATRDMDATIRYWRDLLGLRLVAGVGNQTHKLYFFELAPSQYIAFMRWPEVEPLEEKDHGFPVKGPFGFDHVALGVESDQDLWELKALLDAAGFWVSEIMNHGFIHSLYSFDPNGIPVEFSAPVAEFEPAVTPALADRGPGPAALEGPDPVPGHWPEPGPPTPPDQRTVYPGEGLDLRDPERNHWAKR